MQGYGNHDNGPPGGRQWCAALSCTSVCIGRDLELQKAAMSHLGGWGDLREHTTTCLTSSGTLGASRAAVWSTLSSGTTFA